MTAPLVWVSCYLLSDWEEGCGIRKGKSRGIDLRRYMQKIERQKGYYVYVFGEIV